MTPATTAATSTASAASTATMSHRPNNPCRSCAWYIYSIDIRMQIRIRVHRIQGEQVAVPHKNSAHDSRILLSPHRLVYAPPERTRNVKDVYFLSTHTQTLTSTALADSTLFGTCPQCYATRSRKYPRPSQLASSDVSCACKCVTRSTNTLPYVGFDVEYVWLIRLGTHLFRRNKTIPVHQTDTQSMDTTPTVRTRRTPDWKLGSRSCSTNWYAGSLRLH